MSIKEHIFYSETSRPEFPVPAARGEKMPEKIFRFASLPLVTSSFRKEFLVSVGKKSWVRPCVPAKVCEDRKMLADRNVWEPLI